MVTWNKRKFDGSIETLVFLRIVVLKTNLQFDCLSEISLLLHAFFENIIYGFPEEYRVELTAEIIAKFDYSFIQSSAQKHGPRLSRATKTL